MLHFPLVRLSGAAALALSLAACMDISMEVEVLSQTEAKGTMATTVGADIYQMLAAQQTETDDDGFCDEGELVETPRPSRASSPHRVRLMSSRWATMARAHDRRSGADRCA